MILTIFSSLRIRSNTNSGLTMEISKNRTIRKGRSRRSKEFRNWHTWRSQRQRNHTKRQISTRIKKTLRQKQATAFFETRRSSSQALSEKSDRHKLLSPWEGPFKVSKVQGPGTYELTTMDDIPLKNTWHISHLRRFYAWNAILEYHTRQSSIKNVSSDTLPKATSWR
jgi:hypothetical protein